MADLEQHLHHLKLSVVTRTSKDESIGVGSYASVYEVMVHGTVCAAKEMHPVLVNEANKHAFLSECVRCSRILHPNVVQFLGIYYPSPRARLPRLVMELMYISLRGLIEKYEKDDFPFHFKLSILMDTCNGLEFLHSQNIIHRDLSSNNILLTKHLVAKISDLGMAKVIPAGLQKHTQAPGTVVFMPPEALSVNPQYGKPIDVFSVGCVCVHVISMEWPIPSDKISANNVILSEVQRREQYFTKLVKYPSLEQLVKRCLQDRAEQRPVIEEVTKSLRNVKCDPQPHEDDNIIDLFTSALKCSVQDKQIAQQVQQLVLKDKQLIEKDEQLITKDQQHVEVHKQLAQKDQQLVQTHQQLTQKDQQLVQTHQQLTQKDQQLTQKDQQLTQKDQQLVQKDQQLVQKDQQLVQKDKQLNQKDQIMYEKDQVIKQKDYEILEKEKTITQLKDLNKGNQLHVEGISNNTKQFRKIIKPTVLDKVKKDGSNNKDSTVSKNDDCVPQELPAGHIHLTSLSNDVLSLMQKCGVYKNDHLRYDTKSGCVMIECSGDDKAASTIAEEFQIEYRQLMMGGKLMEHSFVVPATHSSQQIEEIVSQLNTDYSQSIFKYDEEGKMVKCLSMNARQLSHIKTKMKESLNTQGAIKPTIASQPSMNATSLSLTLSGGRRVTLKQANIVEEEVDVIVNAANDRLVHGAVVAAAINKASQGIVQKLSSELFNTNGSIPTGQVVYTKAGGDLKCKYVIHAVGPEQYKHKGQSQQLLWNCCINALQLAENLRAESIAFSPISSGLFGLPKETVAEVLINAVCGYQTQSTALLKDVRIIIIDKETFEAFVPFFDSKRREMKSDSNSHTTATSQPMTFVPQRADNWNDNCPICLNPIVDKETTSCQHSYCRACLEKAVNKKPLCPVCNQRLHPVTGNQPFGYMRYRIIGNQLAGYPQYGTIVITYDIPAGTQNVNHPNPGQPYTGITRVAYLPDSPEGREVLGLLYKAFDAKLIFTVGTSRVLNRTNSVIWNSCISHKTSVDAGPDKYGYPDVGYLQRVKNQLKLNEGNHVTDELGS